MSTDYCGEVFVCDWADHTKTIGLMNLSKGGASLYKMLAGALVDGKTEAQVKAKVTARL